MGLDFENLKQNNKPGKIIDEIYLRKSSRKYSNQVISEQQIKELLDAAIHAPSAMNRQPWAFVVIQQAELLKQISDAAKKRILESAAWAKDLEHKNIPLDNPEFDIFYGAKTLIVICMKQEEGFCPVGDCYLAGENLMLAAQGLGLGTCAIGFARDILQTDEFRKKLSISSDYLPVLPIIVGYSLDVSVKAARNEVPIVNWLK
ncbi:MAG: nitroreductase family protein [Pseudobdellovibrio sp.]